jgi:uncharacterized RDD family membrane protein YckC
MPNDPPLPDRLPEAAGKIDDPGGYRQAWRGGGGAGGSDGLRDPALFEGILSRRLTAYFIDVFLLMIVIAVGWVILGTLTVLSFGLLGPLSVAAMFLLPLAYHSYFIAKSAATPGMKMMDVMVVTLDGRSPDSMAAILQTVLFYLSISVTVWLVLLVVLFTDRNRALHDILAGTLMVRRGAGEKG